MQQAAEQAGRRLRASVESQAIERLYFVAIRLRDALMAVQRDAFAAFADETGFTQVKQRAATETRKIADSFTEDANKIGVERELDALSSATTEALLALPFPRENLQLGLTLLGSRHWILASARLEISSVVATQ